MPRRPTNKPVAWLIEQIDAQFGRLHQDLQGLSLRDKVLRLVGLQHDFSDLGVSIAYEAGIRATGARERIRLYLIAHPTLIINGDELQVVSGIAEYGRRIRELRVEQGYQIASGASPDAESGIELAADEYMLVSAEPDLEAAGRWHVANRIRRGPGGGQQKLLSFLMENVGKRVTTEELAYVAKDAREFARRVRELRTEQGYAIATRFTGRPDLGMGQYVLESADRIAEPHDRNIPDDVQREVYARDSNACRSCGWSHSRWERSDPRILELHHVEEHASGGANTAANLVVVCSRCHDEVHADRIRVEIGAKGIRFVRRT